MTKISPERIAQIEARRDELQALMATGDLPGDRFVQVSKEYAELEPVAAAAGDVRRLRAEAESLEHMTTEADAELRAMAAEELADHQAKPAAADRAPAPALLPREGRQRVMEGKSVAVRIEYGGRRLIKTKQQHTPHNRQQ